MEVRYEFPISAVCPIDGTVDTYEATLLSRRHINVEEILALAAEYHSKPILQERLTEELHNALPPWHCSLTTVGTHSGVRVTVTVES